jgi:hypothetical protein
VLKERRYKPPSLLCWRTFCCAPGTSLLLEGTVLLCWRNIIDILKETSLLCQRNITVVLMEQYYSAEEITLLFWKTIIKGTALLCWRNGVMKHHCSAAQQEQHCCAEETGWRTSSQVTKVPVLCEKNVLGDLEPAFDRPVDERGGGAGMREGGLPGHHPGGLASRPGQRSTNHSQNLVYIFPFLFQLLLFFSRIRSGSYQAYNYLLRIFFFYSFWVFGKKI